LAFQYTKGEGYYENYKEDEKLRTMVLLQFNGGRHKKVDLVRQKWLDNDFSTV
jgi:iron complex outermembrane receptor protein